MSAMKVPSDGKDLRAILAKVQELAVLPHVVFRLLEITASIKTPAVEIEKTIIVDPGFSAKLLKVANSAYYALPRKVTSVREAVMFLGFKSVRQMALTVGVFDLFVGKGDRNSLRRRDWWRHSVDTAVCCKFLAQHTKRMSPEEAYTVGLLHNLGKSLLDRFGDGKFDEVEDMIKSGATEIEAERAVFGLIHTEVAVAASLKWGFAQNLITGLSYLTPIDKIEPGSEIRACVAISSVIAKHAVGLSQDILPQWAIDVLAIPSDEIDRIIQMGRSSIGSAGALQL